jgi:uncharacterized protein YbjT (DUF2867 family)
MTTILIIGASGFIGRHLTKALLAQGYAIRCLTRTPSRLEDLAAIGCKIVQGDISDLASVQRAMASVQAVYIAIHTLSPQPSSRANARFMDVEKNGLQNVITACRSGDINRVIYVTSLRIAPDAPSEWLRERWQTEQLLLNSGLDTTVIRPGYIIGSGGRGFEMILGNAKRQIAVSLTGDRPKMRPIALDDLVYYLTGVLDEPGAYGQCYDVGNDELLSTNQLIDSIADLLGRRHPIKIQMPLALLALLASPIERLAKLPRGAIKGFVDSLRINMIGDPLRIRTILPQPLLSFRQAVEQALMIL